MCRGADHPPSRPLHPNNHLKHTNIHTIHVHVTEILLCHHYSHIQCFFHLCVKCMEFLHLSVCILALRQTKELYLIAVLTKRCTFKALTLLCHPYVTQCTRGQDALWVWRHLADRLGTAAHRERNVTERKLNPQQCDVTETRHSFDYTLKKHQGHTLEFKSVQNLQLLQVFSNCSFQCYFFFFFFYLRSVGRCCTFQTLLYWSDLQGRTWTQFSC